MITNDETMNFMIYRDMVVESKINECVSAIQSGKTEICTDKWDLTSDEKAYLKKKVSQRIKNL